MGGTDVTMSPEALDLFGQIVSANVDEAARISNLLIDMHKREATRFAKAYLDLYESIERIPDTIRSVYLNDLLDRSYMVAEAAHRLIEGDHPS